ncbi:MAG TPA: AMP-binding protein, partial [Burkholderiales bacterium]|nr:AMP-binding protein [Burkholderiales bacterium]
QDASARGAKLTFTSGSTGSPKGILLTAEQQWRTALSLAASLRPMNIRRHLALLPMSVLLENVAGLYTALSLGAEVILPRLADVGLSGSSTFDARKAISAIRETESESAIVLPQMLRAMTTELRASGERMRSLKFLAVGGGKVAPSLIEEARRVGLPVYEGYGLSEACSVVSLNLPGQDRPGSVGKPLAHHAVEIANDGEIRVRDVAAWRIADDASAWTDSGDIGRFDADGFLHVTGRKKNVLITGFGRNVSPEWPEAALLAHPEVLQVMVYGEGQQRLSALIVPCDPCADGARLQAVVDRANETLPDYARIGDWHPIKQPFSVEDGTLTSNGRLKRDGIAARHTSLIYSNSSSGVING